MSTATKKKKVNKLSLNELTGKLRKFKEAGDTSSRYYQHLKAQYQFKISKTENK